MEQQQQYKIVFLHEFNSLEEITFLFSQEEQEQIIQHILNTSDKLDYCYFTQDYKKKIQKHIVFNMK